MMKLSMSITSTLIRSPVHKLYFTSLISFIVAHRRLNKVSEHVDMCGALWWQIQALPLKPASHLACLGCRDCVALSVQLKAWRRFPSSHTDTHAHTHLHFFMHSSDSTSDVCVRVCAFLSISHTGPLQKRKKKKEKQMTLGLWYRNLFLFFLRVVNLMT